MPIIIKHPSDARVDQLLDIVSQSKWIYPYTTDEGGTCRNPFWAQAKFDLYIVVKKNPCLHAFVVAVHKDEVDKN